MSTPTRRRTTSRWAALVVAGMLLSGCGSSEPEPLEAAEPEVPADLCATVPADTRKGLIDSASADETGNPTAACSLRSPTGKRPEVRAVVTWLKTNEEASADEVLDSQCRSIDRQEFRMQSGFSVDGAENACAGSGKADGADSATMAAVSGLEVVTVRLSSRPADGTPANERARAMLEGVLGELAGS
jgi:hypothetical protein